SGAGGSLRAWRADVRRGVEQEGVALVDVRSPDEFTGVVLAPAGLPETCQRGGHIPGAKNIPWARTCNDDGTFKSYDEIMALYGGVGVTPDRSVITYCRIGERSSHSWFVLSYLLGYPDVKNYDGSWTEWAAKDGYVTWVAAQGNWRAICISRAFMSSASISLPRWWKRRDKPTLRSTSNRAI